MNIDWKRKLTSRKFWAAVVGVVTAVLLGFGASESDVTKVTAIVTAGATLIAYILGEGLVDASRLQDDGTYTDDDNRGEPK